MKKNTMMRIAAVVLMCALVTACFASSTFAKYTSAAKTDADTLTVAKWSIQVGTDKTEIAVTGTQPKVTFDLFSTISGHHDGDATDKIAPGTWGAFNIDTIKNNSEVAASILVKVNSVTNASNIPLKFYKTMTPGADGAAPTFSDAITVAKDSLLVEDNEVKAGESVDATTIYWVWDFEDDRDVADTGLGIDAQTTAPTYTIDLEIVATQLD